MNNLIGNATGLIHLIGSVFALITGTLVLFKKKGTKFHIVVGYLYFMSMVTLLTTAFYIYRYNGFDVFHYGAVASSITLICGMLPVWLKKPTKGWREIHLRFMYWSIIGVYIAFAAETFTRIFPENFLLMVYSSLFIITTLGFIFFKAFRESFT